MIDLALKNTLSNLERFRAIFGFINMIIEWLKAIFLGLATLYLWAFIRPSSYLEQAILAVLVFLISLFTGVMRLPRTFHREQFLKALEVKYPKVEISAFNLKCQDERNKRWLPYLNKEKQAFLEFEKSRLGHRISSLVWPFLICLFAAGTSPGEITSAIGGVQDVVIKLSLGADLQIVDGLPEEGLPTQYKLSISEPINLRLLDQNLLQITVVSDSKQLPFVRLKPSSNGPHQTFRLTGQQSQGDQGGRLQSYQATFAVSEDSELYISTLSVSDPAAIIDVETLPVPEVSLNLKEPVEGLWPDEKPLNLTIEVAAQNPLKQVRLSIRTGGQTYQELVTSVMVNDKFSLKTDYSLLLESYVRSDIADIEIVAEAIDRASPVPLVGRSSPLLVRTASAYGRYRSTLQTLRDIKKLLDRNLMDGQEKLNDDVEKLAMKAVEQSGSSPYFDGLDRHQLRAFNDDIKDLVSRDDRAKLLSTIDRLNEFLFEHETLDDRERDRDFFVAARTLSRIIEQDNANASLTSDVVVNRMLSYLSERMQRWKLRVDFLGEKEAPLQWSEIKKGLFEEELNAVLELDQQDKKTESLNRLSELVSDYKNWIEQLEQSEDRKREKMRQQQRQGLADARNALKELQQRQGKVSKNLDRADQRSRDQLSSQWPSVRMDQNGNIKGTRSLEAQLRSLSPMAAERIEAARKSMQQAVSAGNEGQFTNAESSADLAGRLLRQADNAAQKSQKQQQQRGRRRRISSDQYFGTPVAGGDVEIRQDYSVDPRYRENILDQVRRSQQNQEGSDDNGLLESYLRQVIR